MVGDLFFYRQPNFTLKSGDRAYLNLFKKELPYRHVFTADLTGWTPDSGSQPDVWNTILFQNTGTPLTTAPAVTMKGGEVLGQDRLDYTADGAEGRLRITKSLEIQTDMVEEETARERGVIRNSDNRPIFDLVTLKVTLKARNLRKEESELDISRTHPGTVTVNDPAVKPTQISAGLSSANQMVKVRWQPKLRAGEKAETSYTYQVYVGSAFGR
ncbi:MAG: hypothetical protein MH204_04880 [Fimbriimonadaceae bacterium]|nr:hypothetical protein [Fimbriimonadaceae bacterium]